MKKSGLAVVLALMAVGVLTAETVYIDGDTFVTEQGASTRTVHVSGVLVRVNGRLSIKSDGKTWYLEGIQKLTGPVEGLTAGAAVTAEGIAKLVSYPPEYVYVHLTKLTFNGTDYIFNEKSHRDAKDSEKDGHR